MDACMGICITQQMHAYGIEQASCPSEQYVGLVSGASTIVAIGRVLQRVQNRKPDLSRPSQFQIFRQCRSCPYQRSSFHRRAMVGKKWDSQTDVILCTHFGLCRAVRLEVLRAYLQLLGYLADGRRLYRLSNVNVRWNRVLKV